MKRTVYLDTTILSYLFDERESLETYIEVTKKWCSGTGPDPGGRETLGSGFTSTVATRLALREAGSERLVAENRLSISRLFSLSAERM